MKRTLVTLIPCLGALLATCLPAAETADLGFRVHRSIEVEYPTLPGKSYAVQVSTNLIDWSDVGTSVPGTSRTVHRLISAHDDAVNGSQYYRLHVTDGPTNGFAPWALTGISIEFDDEPGGDVVNFSSATAGTDVSEGDSDPFVYLFSRQSENEALAEVTYASNRYDVITFTFSGPGVGTWSRDEYRDGKLKDRDVGPFRIVGIAPATAGTNGPVVNPNVTVAPLLTPPAPPVSLSNLVYYFQSSGVPDRYDFLDDRNGREIQGVVQEGLPTNALVYTYNVLGSNTAFLRLSFGYYGMGGDRYDCDLTFTDGSSGHFVRKLYRRGVLKDTDEGAFSEKRELTLPDQTNANPPPVGTNATAGWPPAIVPTAPPAPLAALQGRTCYVFLTPYPDVYQFAGPNYGYAFPGAGARDEEVEVSPNGNVYTYAYTVSTSNTASLVITYGYYNLGGDREEYDLTYVDGSTATFNRRLYRLGNLYTNQAGVFSTTSVLPYSFPGTTNQPPGDYDFQLSTGEFLTFNSATSGVQTDDSAPTDFTYVLTVTGANTASLRVQFKADKWDEYDLTYTDATHGSFLRRQYDKNVLKDTDAGQFSAKQPPI